MLSGSPRGMQLFRVMEQGLLVPDVSRVDRTVWTGSMVDSIGKLNREDRCVWTCAVSPHPNVVLCLSLSTLILGLS